MISQQTLFNLVAGASVLFWSVQGILNNEVSTVRICITLVQLTVGCLFLFRAPLRLPAKGLRVIVVTLAPFLVNGLVFHVSPPPSQWWPVAIYVFVAGSALTVVSLFYLGRSFAIMPALREIRTGGPYRFVRHPAYLGEMLMFIGCLLSFDQWWLATLALIAVFIVFGTRILVEEDFLKGESIYEEYCERVKWRLLPFAW